MSKLKYKIKRFFAYRKLKRCVMPALRHHTSELIDTKDINLIYIIPFLVDLVVHRKDTILVVNNSLRDFIDSIEELNDYNIMTVHDFTYFTTKGKTIVTTPLDEECFDVMYTHSFLDKDNFYKILL